MTGPARRGTIFTRDVLLPRAKSPPLAHAFTPVSHSKLRLSSFPLFTTVGLTLPFSSLQSLDLCHTGNFSPGAPTSYVAAVGSPEYTAWLLLPVYPLTKYSFPDLGPHLCFSDALSSLPPDPCELASLPRALPPFCPFSPGLWDPRMGSVHHFERLLILSAW